MGSMISSVTKHITLKTLAAHSSSGMKSSTNLYDASDLMAPEPDEIPSRPGSAFSRDREAGRDASLQSDFLWPYVDRGAHDDYSESEHPLSFRRPALYEEYWADESE